MLKPRTLSGSLDLLTTLISMCGVVDQLHVSCPVLLQALFFGVVDLMPYEGFYWMGASVLCLSSVSCILLYWPM